MNRRDFLTKAAIAVAAMQIDPEMLLWTPGKKTFFLPEQKPALTLPPGFYKCTIINVQGDEHITLCTKEWLFLRTPKFRVSDEPKGY